MKKLILIAGGLLITVALIVSIIQWNTKVDMTTEKAKEDLTAITEKELRAADDHPSDDRDAVVNTQDSDDNSAETNNDPADDNGAVTNVDPSHNNDASTTTETPDKGDATTSTQGTEQESPSNKKAEQDAPQPQSSSETNETTSGHSNSSQRANKSLSEIKSAYGTIFTDLAIQEASKIDGLLVQAKADYVSGEYSKSALVEKYSARATQLERQADSSFNAIYYQLQTDLDHNGHDQNAAAEFRNEYNKKKQERRTHAMGQLQGF